MTRLLAALAILIVATGFVAADNYQRQYQNPVVVVPSYGAGYAPRSAITDELLEAILKEIRALRAENRALKNGASPDAPAHVQVYLTSCVKCHDKAVADKKGDGFVLMDGNKELPLSADQIGTLLELCHEGDMPKNGPKLDDDSYSKIVLGMSRKLRELNNNKRAKPKPQILPINP